MMRLPSLPRCLPRYARPPLGARSRPGPRLCHEWETQSSGIAPIRWLSVFPPVEHGYHNATLRPRPFSTLPAAGHADCLTHHDGDTVSAQNVLDGFMDAYGLYAPAAAARLPSANNDDLPSLSVLKRRLKISSRLLAGHVQALDHGSAVALIACLVRIGRRCRCPELSAATLQHVLRTIRSGDMNDHHSKCAAETLRIDAAKHFPPAELPWLTSLTSSESSAPPVALVLRALRTFDLRSPPAPLLDDLLSIAGSTVYKCTTVELVGILRDVAWVCRFSESDGFRSLLRKCISLVCEGAAKSGVTLSRMQLITLLKALSAVGVESSSLATRVVQLISSLLRVEQEELPADVADRVNVLYRRAKCNVHLLHVMLVSGLCVDVGVVNSLLDGVMAFCLEYFSATCRYWQPKKSQASTQDYNSLDPRVYQLLYARYPNKVIRAPGSLSSSKDASSLLSSSQTSLRETKLEQKYQTVVASMSRLLDSGKVAFCRGLKLCDVQLRVSQRALYSRLNESTRMFLCAVSVFRFEEPGISDSEQLDHYLRRIGLRPATVMVDGTFRVNCVDHERRLFCELCHHKEAKTSTGGGVVYNVAYGLKMQYLAAAGWRGATVLAHEWRARSEAERIALLRAKLAPFD